MISDPAVKLMEEFKAAGTVVIPELPYPDHMTAPPSSNANGAEPATLSKERAATVATAAAVAAVLPAGAPQEGNQGGCASPSKGAGPALERMQSLEAQSNGTSVTEPADFNPASAAYATAATTAAGAPPSVGGGLPVLPSVSARERSRKDAPLICHIQGCEISLTTQAEYYQRYRICRSHLRSPALIVDGVPQRFCQQCGRFHTLDAFDGDKRNCRARLAQHNSRRRKAGTLTGTGSQVANGSSRRAASARLAYEDDMEYEPDNDLERLRKSIRAAGGNQHSNRGDSAHLSGSRRSRDLLEDLYGAAMGAQQLPPAARPRIEAHNSEELEREQMMRTLLARYYSEPHQSSMSHSAFGAAMKEVESMLGRKVLQALLQEGGVMPHGHYQQPQSTGIPGLDSEDLLRLLVRSLAPQPPPQHSAFAGFGAAFPSVASAGGIPTFHSTPITMHSSQYSAPRPGQALPAFPTQNSALDALRHLAATVPRSGYPAQSNAAQAPYLGMPAMPKPDQPPPQQQQQPMQRPPQAAPPPANPFMQHRDALLQQLAAAAAAAEQAQSPEQQKAAPAKNEELGDQAPGPARGGAGEAAPPAQPGAEPASMSLPYVPPPAAVPSGKEPDVESMRRLLETLGSRAAAAGGGGGGEPHGPAGPAPPSVAAIAGPHQDRLLALLMQMSALPAVGAGSQ